MGIDDIIKQAENDRNNRLERFDKQVSDSRKKLENLTLDIRDAELKKKDLLAEVTDLENAVKSALDTAFKKKQDELDMAKSEVIASQKLVDQNSAKLKEDNDSHEKNVQDLEVRKIAVEKTEAFNAATAEKHQRIKAKLDALKQTIKDNLDAADE